ncbi:MAG TPA: hypothetical protein PLA97_08625 [Rubrivivax sp.]|nr:hypothetical protein [Rubrivivax sp.]
MLNHTWRAALMCATSALALALPLQSRAATLCLAQISSATQGSTTTSGPLPACGAQNGYINGGQSRAEATVANGILRAGAQASTNANQPDEGTSLGALAEAKLSDRITVSTGLAADVEVLLTFGVAVDGFMSSAILLAPPPFFGFQQNTAAYASFAFSGTLDNISDAAPGAGGLNLLTGCVFAPNPSVSVCNGFAPQSGAVIDEMVWFSVLASDGDVLELNLSLRTEANARGGASHRAGSG